MSVSRHVEMASCLKEVLVIYYVDDASESFESIVRSVCEGLTIASSEESACSAAHELRLKVYSSLWLCASEVIHALDKCCGAYACSPRVDSRFTSKDEFYRALDTCTWIPSGAFLHVFEVHFHRVLSHLHEVCDVHSESIIAVSPVTCFLSIDIDGRL